MAPHVKTACVLHSPLPVFIALPRLLHHGQQPKRGGRRARCSAEALDLPTALSTRAHAPPETASKSEEAQAGNEERAAEVLTGAEVKIAAAEGRCRGVWESGVPPRGSFTARLGCWLRSKHNRDLADLAVPALFSIALDPLMNLVDTALVGRLGPAPLAAVGLSGILFSFCFVVFNFLLFVTTPRVAASVATGDMRKASQTTAQGLWVAIISGALLGVFIWNAAPLVVTRLLGAEPAVAMHAITYLRCRCIACPALLGIMVATGSFRGFRDTRTPMVAAVAANLANLGLDIVLMFGLGWGVAGAALATSASHYISVGVLYFKLLRQGKLFSADLRRVPSRQELTPLFKSGLSLSIRSVVIMGTYVFGTSLVASLGSVALAANEISRQVFIMSIQLFSALDIAVQTLVATYLGRGNRAMARDVLLRSMQIAAGLGLGVGAAVLAVNAWLPTVFTSDAAVAVISSRLLRLLAYFMPLDAVAAVMDGGLLGAQETGYVGIAAVYTSAAVVAALLLSHRTGAGVVQLWLCFKLMTLGRCISGTLRYLSPNSAFAIIRKREPAMAAAAS